MPHSKHKTFVATIDQDPQYTLRGASNEIIKVPISAATSSRLVCAHLGSGPSPKRDRDPDDDTISQSSDDFDRTFCFDIDEEALPREKEMAGKMEKVAIR